MLSIYGEGVTIPDGLLAESNWLPLSLYSFILIMGIMSFISIYIMNSRKQKILNETYSKLSIFKTK